MIDLYEYAVDKALEYISGPRTKYSHKFWFRCVFCGDSQKDLKARRAWLISDHKQDVHFHCYNCGRHFGVYKFLMELEGKTYKEIRSDVFSIYKDMGFGDAIKHILGENNNNTCTDPDEPIVKKEEPSFDLKSTWEDIKLHPEINKIIENRCLYDAPNIPKRFRLYYDTKYKRIIIPWYRDNKLKYYQSRAIGKSTGGKYMFPKGTEKDIYGLDNIDPDFPYVFFLEGVFDSVWVKNGICVGGAMFTTHQKKILQMILETHELIYLPDNPFIDKRGKEEILKLCEKDRDQRIFMWDKKSKYKDINAEMISTGNYEKYMDEDFLKKSIVSTAKYHIMLKFSK